jgi:hypothetical protein
MSNERLNRVINQICHAWEEQQAEHEGKMRSLANSIVSEHETERFNTQKAFKSALAAKNNEINALLSECKKLKALVTHIHTENKELQKKLSNANRTIESLRQGGMIQFDDNGFSKKTFSEDSTFPNDDSQSVGNADFYGNADDLSSVGSSHGQIPNWNIQQQNRPQPSHLFARDRRSPDVDFGYHQGGGGGSSTGGYYPETDHHGRSSAPPSNVIGGLFSSSTNSQFPSRQGPAHLSHGLVFGGRFVLDGSADDPVAGLYHREDLRMDRAGSYDSSRPDRDRDSEEFRPSSSVHDDARHFPDGQGLQQSQAASKARLGSVLSPAASPFLPGAPSGPSPIGRAIGAPIGFAPTPAGSSPAKPAPVPLKVEAPPPGFETFPSERDQIYSPFESNRSQSSSIGSVSQQADSTVGATTASSASSLAPQASPGLEEDSKPSSLSGSGTEDPTNTSAVAAAVSGTANDEAAILTQMRLQSKSSKLDAKPLPTPVSPTNPTLRSPDSL